MITDTNTPIFIQLCNTVKEQILDGKLKADERIPSVREIAATYEVNNNTAMRSVELLGSEGIIYQKRGVGYFVSQQAFDIIKNQKQADFLNAVLPQVRKTVLQLGIKPEEFLQMVYSE
ncbi:MAG: GntR family transcriptional regulator [Bacteroidales bacterium]|nr:GntR family transcriptional regulator [Bacteroidales bacterium]MBP3254819.1 GntR family transcriptional regulator [Bacteroidales bacterium]